MFTRKQKIKFIAMVRGMRVEEAELYYALRSEEYLENQFDKYQDVAEQNDLEFAAV